MLVFLNSTMVNLIIHIVKFMGFTPDTSYLHFQCLQNFTFSFSLKFHFAILSQLLFFYLNGVFICGKIFHSCIPDLLIFSLNIFLRMFLSVEAFNNEEHHQLKPNFAASFAVLLSLSAHWCVDKSELFCLLKTLSCCILVESERKKSG